MCRLANFLKSVLVFCSLCGFFMPKMIRLKPNELIAKSWLLYALDVLCWTVPFRRLVPRPQRQRPHRLTVATRQRGMGTGASDSENIVCVRIDRTLSAVAEQHAEQRFGLRIRPIRKRAGTVIQVGISIKLMPTANLHPPRQVPRSVYCLVSLLVQ
jgi:hypothetical protein